MDSEDLQCCRLFTSSLQHCTVYVLMQYFKRVRCWDVSTCKYAIAISDISKMELLIYLEILMTPARFTVSSCILFWMLNNLLHWSFTFHKTWSRDTWIDSNKSDLPLTQTSKWHATKKNKIVNSSNASKKKKWITGMCAEQRKWTYCIVAFQLIGSLTPFIRVVQKHCLVCSRTD